MRPLPAKWLRGSGKRAETSDRSVKARIVQGIWWRPRGNLATRRPHLHQATGERILRRGVQALEAVPEDYEYKFTDADGNEVAMGLLWVGLPDRSRGSVPE
jgi:hypothetical protein